jgi:FHS family L-fucose permease-like MFS transporter
MKDMAPDTSEKTAAFFLSMNLLLFMLGRFSGSFLMTYIRPNRLLSAYALINIILVIIGIAAKGMTAVYAMMLVSFFMSIMFPTIFAMGIKGLGEDTKIASSLIIMSIIGGAIFPLLMGYIAISNIQLAMGVPLVCFVVVLAYGLVVGRRSVVSS